MSAPVLVVASLAILLGVAHSYLGERYILIRLLRSGSRGTSLLWPGSTSGLLFHLASPSGGGVRTQARVISITFMASDTVSLFGSHGRHLSWVVFFVIAGLTWLAFP